MRGGSGVYLRESVPVYSRVCLCSPRLISVKKLGRDVFKGACSNYGRARLSRCSTPVHSGLLRQTWLPRRPPARARRGRGGGSPVAPRTPAVFSAHYDLGSFPIKGFLFFSFFFSFGSLPHGSSLVQEIRKIWHEREDEKPELLVN